MSQSSTTITSSNGAVDFETTEELEYIEVEMPS